jgi:hypothetical protein
MLAQASGHAVDATMQLSLEVIFDSEDRNESPVLAGMRECLTG